MALKPSAALDLRALSYLHLEEGGVRDDYVAVTVGVSFLVISLLFIARVTIESYDHHGQFSCNEGGRTSFAGMACHHLSLLVKWGR